MRLITSDSNEEFLEKFCRTLAAEGIDFSLEKSNDTWGIWILDEDQVDQAKALFDEYRKDPHAQKFQIKTKLKVPEVAPQKPTARVSFKPHFVRASRSHPFGKITLAIVLISLFLTFFGDVQIPRDSFEERATLQTMLMYDQNMSWPGYYYLYIASLSASQASELLHQLPPFSSFMENEWWRLFTPCLLHSNILHLFFNMLWLIMLGNQVERHLGKGRYILLMLLIGIVSNTCQYLMSGPAFLGFSGVVSGLFTFVWFRQKFAAWEGYMLAPSTALFLTIFLLGMAGLELLSFCSILLSHFGIISFTIPSNGVANTAHLSGAICGIIFARLNFFRQKYT